MNKRIGDFLVERGLLTRYQVDEIVRYGLKHKVRFGQAGIHLKFLTPEKMIELFGPSYRVDFFYLHPEHFPQSTKDLLSIENIIKLGALPLGIKSERKFFRSKKYLSLGLLNPKRQEGIQEVVKLAGLKFLDSTLAGTRISLVLPDQFVSVLESVYGAKDEEILNSARFAEVDPVLKAYLQSQSGVTPIHRA